MAKADKIIKNTFENGSVRDALIFLNTCVHNAFPEFNFRGMEVTKLVTGKRIVEGKSWNHEFKVKQISAEAQTVWEVSCHRTSYGESTDKKAFLNAETLELI